VSIPITKLGELHQASLAAIFINIGSKNRLLSRNYDNQKKEESCVDSKDQ
jgi:hypothetical protein